MERPIVNICPAHIDPSIVCVEHKRGYHTVYLSNYQLFYSMFVEIVWTITNIFVCWFAIEYSTDMITSSNGNIFRVTGHLCREFSGPRRIPRTKASDDFFDLPLNKRLSKQSKYSSQNKLSYWSLVKRQYANPQYNSVISNQFRRTLHSLEATIFRNG